MALVVDAAVDLRVGTNPTAGLTGARGSPAESPHVHSMGPDAALTCPSLAPGSGALTRLEGELLGLFGHSRCRAGLARALEAPLLLQVDNFAALVVPQALAG
jgi:hypothetical protein